MKCKHIYEEVAEVGGGCTNCGFCLEKHNCMREALKTGLNLPWLDDMK